LILLDSNILIYAAVSSMPEHERASAWLDEQLAGTARVGFPWLSLLAFLRITTKRGSFAHPQPIAHAWRQVRDWLDQPPAWIPMPTERHAEILQRLCVDASANGDLVSDAHLAALAIEYHLTLCSNDRDFARFPDLRWINPLTE
jgi:uncharacterized protein